MAATVTVFFLRGRRSKKVATQEISLPTIGALLLTNTSSLFAPTVISATNISPNLLVNSSSVFSPAVSRGLAILPAKLTNSSTIYSPTLNRTITPALLTNSSAFFTPVLSGYVLTNTLTNSSTVYAPQVNLTLNGALLTNSSTIYSPVVVQGAAIKANTLVNASTVYSPSLTRKLYATLLTNNSIIPFPTVSGSVSLALSTPDVTLVSAVGQPPQVDITMGSDIWPGYYLRIQRSTTGAKNVSDGSYVSPTINLAHMVQPGEVAALAITNADLVNDGYTDPSGVWFQQYRWEREDGALSAWGTEVSGTVTVATTALYSVAGFNCKSGISITGTPALVSQGASGTNSPQCVRCTNSKTGKKQFEVTVTTMDSNSIFVGLDDNSTDLNAAYVAPGFNNTKGVALRMSASGFDIWKAGAVVASGSLGAANNDVISTALDTTAGTCSFYRTRSGSTVLVGTVTGILLSEYRAYQGSYNAGKLTANYGQSAQTRPFDTGYTAYG